VGCGDDVAHRSAVVREIVLGERVQDARVAPCREILEVPSNVSENANAEVGRTGRAAACPRQRTGRRAACPRQRTWGGGLGEAGGSPSSYRGVLPGHAPSANTAAGTRASRRCESSATRR
jgi:hypothetical protein